MIEKVMKLLSKVPPEGFQLLGKLIDAISGSNKPLEAMKRATLAAAARKGFRERL